LISIEKSQEIKRINEQSGLLKSLLCYCVPGMGDNLRHEDESELCRGAGHSLQAGRRAVWTNA